MRAEAESARERNARTQPDIEPPEPLAHPKSYRNEPGGVTYVREYMSPGAPSTVPVLPQDNPSDEGQYSRAIESQMPAPGHMAAPAQAQPSAPPPQRPSWLYQEAAPQPPQPSPTVMQDTLQHQRERVAGSRWFALKGVFEQHQQDIEQPAAPRREGRAPVVAVFSLAGGVGKTSLVATLGRALSSFGERDLLVDTSSYGLLPFYFGSREWRPGSVRTFSPPNGTTDAAINLVTYDGENYSREGAGDWLQEELGRSGYGMQRILLDVSNTSSPLARQALNMASVVLVPVVPDLNSVVSLTAVDNYLRQFVGSDGRPLQAHYLLNQFDPSLPLHLDVREVLRQQLGDRLLPIVVHRSPAVSEALAEGMTVVDYAPGTPVAEDFLNVAAWLRTVSAPASGVAAYRGARWSER